MLSEFCKIFNEYLPYNKIIELNKYKDLSLLINTKETIVYKIALIGDTNSGKSEILKNYSENKVKFSGYILLLMDIYIIKLIIYEKNYEFLKKEEKVDGIIFIFDITLKESYEKMKECINNLKMNNNNDYESIICANKIDLELERKILSDELTNYASNQNIKIFETSAKTGKNINEAFNELINQLLLKEGNKNLISEFLEYFGTREFKQLNKFIDF